MERVMDALGRLLFGLIVVVVLVGAWAAFGAVRAQSYIPVPTTPDLSVTATATAEFRFDKTPGIGGRVDWVWIKNDCAKTLWFDLRGAPGAHGKAYPIRLEGRTQALGVTTTTQDAQVFSGPFVAYSIGVSPDNTGTTCTFTLKAGVKN